MIKGVSDVETGEHIVYIDNKILSPTKSQQVYNHSPDGFCWGYGGSGPSQLALALLLEFTNKEEAIKFYQEFKWEIVAKLPKESFELPKEKILSWLEQRRNK